MGPGQHAALHGTPLHGTRGWGMAHRDTAGGMRPPNLQFYAGSAPPLCRYSAAMRLGYGTGTAGALWRRRRGGGGLRV